MPDVYQHLPVITIWLDNFESLGSFCSSIEVINLYTFPTWTVIYFNGITIFKILLSIEYRILPIMHLSFYVDIQFYFSNIISCWVSSVGIFYDQLCQAYSHMQVFCYHRFMYYPIFNYSFSSNLEKLNLTPISTKKI